MKHRFLLCRLSHTVMVVDLTEIGLPTETYPLDGKKQTVPTLRLQSWKDVELYFLSLGADAEALGQTSAQFNNTGFGVLTIV
jgi:hypothetical protein